MTMLNLFTKLKKYNKGNYRQFSFCYALSVILVSTLTLFMLSPFVQSRLPIGGDSRKMLYMVYAVAVLGCVLFIIYATGLFLRFKSREVGIFMALGTPKRVLAKTLTKEIVLLILKLGIAGIIIGGVIAFVFGKVYEGFVQSATGDSFSLPLTGFIGSFLFVTITVCIVMGMAVRFLKRANLIEILNEERRTEPIKKNVDTKYLVWGIILIAVGLLGGLIIPYIVSTMLKRSLSGFPYIFYVLVFIGLYRVMVYSIAVHKKGRHPQKYYKNLISFGMMKFQGISVVRNMLIVTLLIAGSLFAIFFSATNLIQGLGSAASEANDISYRYLGDAEKLTQEQVEKLAEDYQVGIDNYREAEFLRLLGSGVSRENYDKSGKLIEEYRKQDYIKNFISADEFERVTGIAVNVQPGMYQYISREGNNENYWFLPDDLDLVQNPDSGLQKPLSYAGTVEYSSFFYHYGQDGNANYILNDEDYAELEKGLSDEMHMTHILFDLSDTGDTYGFSKDLYARYCNSVSDSMKKMSAYDEYREATDSEYSYSEPVEIEPERLGMEIDWKYAPVFVPIQEKSFVQSYATLLLIFIFVAIVCLVSAGVIGYTRSITVAIKSKSVLMDVKKLGADRTYLNRVLKEQVKKVYVLPTIVAVVLMFVYYTLTLWQNDGTITLNEYPMIAVNVLTCLAVCIYQYVLYRYSLKKAGKVIFEF
ncbi:MAG: FtsX-like permease family protein [Roseburia sp. 1XD42-69]|jgi:putative ABC transport system permease protein